MDVDIITINLHKKRKVTGTIVGYRRGSSDDDSDQEEVPVGQDVSELRAQFRCENCTTKPPHFDDFVVLEHGKSLRSAGKQTMKDATQSLRGMQIAKLQRDSLENDVSLLRKQYCDSRIQQHQRNQDQNLQFCTTDDQKEKQVPNSSACMQELNSFLLSRAGSKKYGVTDVKKYTNPKISRTASVQQEEAGQTGDYDTQQEPSVCVSEQSQNSPQSPGKQKKLSIKQRIAMKKAQKMLRKLQQQDATNQDKQTVD